MESCVTRGDTYPFPLSSKTQQWISYYCRGTYIYRNSSSTTLPLEVVEELSRVKKCEGSGVVYRGMSFGLLNYDVFMAYYNAIDPVTHMLEITTKLLMSTSKNIGISMGFMESNLLGLLLELQLEKEDILVDLTLLDNNTFIEEETYYKREEEVIALPGSYSVKVINYDELVKSVEKYSQLASLYEILSPYFNDGQVLDASVDTGYNTIILTTSFLRASFVFDDEDCSMSLSIRPGELFIGKEITLHLPQQDIVFSRDNPFHVEGDVLEFVAENIEELFGDKGVITKRSITTVASVVYDLDAPDLAMMDILKKSFPDTYQ